MPFEIPPKVAEAFEALRQPKAENPDGLDWARKIMKRVESGHPPSQAAVEAARAALTGRNYTRQPKETL